MIRIAIYLVILDRSTGRVIRHTYILAVKVNGSNVKPGICVRVNTRSEHRWSYETDSLFDVTSINFNFNSQIDHEDKIFERQDMLQFLSLVPNIINM